MLNSPIVIRYTQQYTLYTYTAEYPPLYNNNNIIHIVMYKESLRLEHDFYAYKYGLTAITYKKMSHFYVQKIKKKYVCTVV